MGHVVNPIAFRLGKVVFWRTNYIHFRFNRGFKKYFFFLVSFFKILQWIYQDKTTLRFFYHRADYYYNADIFLREANVHNFHLNFVKRIENFNLYKFFIYVRLKFGNNEKPKMITDASLYRRFRFINYYSFIKYFSIFSFKFPYKAEILEAIETRKRFLSRPMNLKKAHRLQYFKRYNIFLKFFQSMGAQLSAFSAITQWSLVMYFLFKPYGYNRLRNSLRLRCFNLKQFQQHLSQVKRLDFKTYYRDLELEVSYHIHNYYIYFSNNRFKVNLCLFREDVLDKFFENCKKFRFNSVYSQDFKRLRIKLSKRLYRLNLIYKSLLFNYSFYKKLVFRYSATILHAIKFYLRESFHLHFAYRLGYLSHLLVKLGRDLEIDLNGFFFKKQHDRHLNQVFSELNAQLPIEIHYHVSATNFISSHIIYKFIIRQLGFNRKIPRIMRVVLNELKKTKYVHGYKILLRGRFTRKERAFNKVWSFGRLPTSTVTLPINYFAGTFVSKFGLGSIRIWLFRNP